MCIFSEDARQTCSMGPAHLVATFGVCIGTMVVLLYVDTLVVGEQASWCAPGRGCTMHYTGLDNQLNMHICCNRRGGLLRIKRTTKYGLNSFPYWQ